MVIFCINLLFHELSEQINERHKSAVDIKYIFSLVSTNPMKNTVTNNESSLLLFGFLSFAISCFIVKVYHHVSCFTFCFLSLSVFLPCVLTPVLFLHSLLVRLFPHVSPVIIHLLLMYHPCS